MVLLKNLPVVDTAGFAMRRSYRAEVGIADRDAGYESLELRKASYALVGPTELELCLLAKITGYVRAYHRYLSPEKYGGEFQNGRDWFSE